MSFDPSTIPFNDHCIVCKAPFYHNGSPSNRLHNWNAHVASNAHQRKLGKNGTQQSKVVATTKEKCHECGGTVTFMTGDIYSKSNSWKQHRELSVAHRHVRERAAAIASLRVPRSDAISAAQLFASVRSDAVSAAQLFASVRVPRSDAVSAAQLFASVRVPRSDAVSAARLFARKHYYPGRYTITVLSHNVDGSFALAVKAACATPFRRAACARDEVIRLTTEFGVHPAAEDVFIQTVPVNEASSLRRRQCSVASSHRGQRRELRGALQFQALLDKYALPLAVRQEVSYPETEVACQTYLRRRATFVNNEEKLHDFLFCEEACVKASLREYDMEDVQFRSGSFGLLRLKVPGLAEKRPSVLCDDAIEAIDGTTMQRYTGYVHFVYHDDIDVSFSQHVTLNKSYSIHFTCKRTEFRLLHRAVDRMVELGRPLLAAKDATDATAYRTYDVATAPLQNLNERQRLFADSLGRTKLRILWGPPGTGKTTTIAACIASIALCARQHGLTILVATPSNGASNLIVTKLLEHGLLPKTDVLRVMALTRAVKEVPINVQPACCTMTYDDEHQKDKTVTTFCSPSKEEVTKATVIVATLGSCNRLYSLYPDLKFSHVFVDECGQATEPEFLSALQFDGLEHVVIAGDPKQLGPITTSLAARQNGNGLNRSPLVRLIEQEGADNTMLCECYRCHPDILGVFNSVFYNNLLTSAATRVKWTTGPVAGFKEHRVKFVHCDGYESYDRQSPSIMNIHEADLVMNEVISLKDAGVPLKDIVVIAPYALQVKKIREMLKFPLKMLDKEWLSNHVCSVEAFQGREAKYIILSCVRSPEDIADADATNAIVSGDVRRHLGFLSQPQRSNVALSRAIDGMIIIGNLRLLWRDVRGPPPESRGVWRPVLDALHTAGAQFERLDPSRLVGYNAVANIQVAQSVVLQDEDPDSTQHGIRRFEE